MILEAALEQVEQPEQKDEFPGAYESYAMHNHPISLPKAGLETFFEGLTSEEYRLQNMIISSETIWIDGWFLVRDRNITLEEAPGINAMHNQGTLVAGTGLKTFRNPLSPEEYSTQNVIMIGQEISPKSEN